VQSQRLRRVQRWSTDHLAVDQPVQQVQNVRFGGSV
jgi:hypothetical protein